MSENVILSNESLSAEISALGAELVVLRDASGADWLHDGDPRWWTGRAPILFPMVGRAVGDAIRIDGQTCPLPQHGFARRSTFETVATTPESALLRLRANEATRAAYPFAFRLDLAYALDQSTLKIAATVFNEDERPLPCSLGFHPAFRWPLPGGEGAHDLRFSQPEAEPIRRLANGLLEGRSYPNPAATGVLPLDPSLFEQDALIFDQLRSRLIAYGPPDGPEVELYFPDMPHFGLWSKPGASFLCLEPWQGYAAPEGLDGEFAQRPGVVSIAPGDQRRFAMDITIKPAARTDSLSPPAGRGPG